MAPRTWWGTAPRQCGGHVSKRQNPTTATSGVAPGRVPCPLVRTPPEMLPGGIRGDNTTRMEAHRCAARARTRRRARRPCGIGARRARAAGRPGANRGPPPPAAAPPPPASGPRPVGFRSEHSCPALCHPAAERVASILCASTDEPTLESSSTPLQPTGLMERPVHRHLLTPLLPRGPMKVTRA